MSAGKLSKREIQGRILSVYEGFLQGQQTHNLSIEIWQKRLRTDAKVCISWCGRTYCDVGFASLSYLDTWDAEYGEKMAIHKAIAGIAKQIAYGFAPAQINVLTSPSVTVTVEQTTEVSF